MKKITTVVFLLIIPQNLFAQADTLLQNESAVDLIEEISSESEDSQIYDLLEQLSDNPIQINIAGKTDLIRIPFLDFQTANKIVDFREKNGFFKDVTDLYKIYSIDKETIEKILPYITFTDYSDQNIFQNLFSFQNMKVNFRTRGIVDLQDSKGLQENKFAGSRWKNYQRLQVESNDKFRLGLLTEKDPGESSFNDFYSFHFQIKNLGCVNKLIIGDYLLEFGQGLAMWSPYGLSKSTDAVNTIGKKDRGIVPYTSSNENQFLRGVSAQLNFGNFQMIPFFSSHKVDASIDSITSFVISTPVDGMHRTQSELNRKNTLLEKTFGISLKYNFLPNLSTEFLYYKTNFGNSFTSNSAFDISGNEFEFYSFSYSSFWKSVFVTGEFCYNRISAASINNIEIAVSKDFTFVSSFRNYPRNFVNIYSNGMGERSGTQNEIGFYTGFKLKTAVGTINFYYDQFKFPYATYYNPVPTSGREFLVYYYVRPFNKTVLTLKYKNENKEVAKVYSNENIIDNQIIQNIRLDLTYTANKFVTLKTRLESVFLSFTKTKDDAEKGFLVFQDVRIKPFSSLLLYLRAAFFKTDSYNSRVYEFENDLTGIVTNPPLYGKGLRWYLVAKYSLPLGITISMKYSELYEPEERTLGSGYSEINSNLDNSLNLQLDVKL